MSEIKDLSYEQARTELVEVVQALESPNVPLEQALELWERGQGLVKHCQAFLDQAQARISEAVAGTPTADTDTPAQ